MAVFFGLVFPALLLFLIGVVFPGATDPSPDLGGRRLVDLYAPVAIGFGLATVGVSLLPAILGTDRERGILRRLSTTPVHPRVLVGAHLTVQLIVAICSTVAAVLVGALVFDIALPQSPGWFIVSFLLGAGALLGIGLLIGALVPNATAGQATGMILYFPLLFFAGVYIPREVMPEGMRVLSGYTPSGAAVEAISTSWAGSAPATSSLLVMGAYAVAAGLLAIWLFRWE
jgi:ABC-2 type transport system permease protein